MGKSTAWGSWRSAHKPVLRDTHEFILVFSKGQYELEPANPSVGRGYTIGAKDFLKATLSVWHIPAERNSSAVIGGRKIRHPSPFPIKLARRLIELYSHPGDTVLDPFLGSGTTAVAALETGRHFVGYEISSDYVDLADYRVAQARLPRQMSFEMFGQGAEAE